MLCEHIDPSGNLTKPEQTDDSRKLFPASWHAPYLHMLRLRSAWDEGSHRVV